MKKLAIVFCVFVLACGGQSIPEKTNCTAGDSKCVGDTVHTCKDGEFALFDDCSARDELCSVFGGEAVCYVEHGDSDADTDSDSDTDVDTDSDSDTDADTNCTPNAYKGCFGGDVHWFDSCDNAQGLIVDCPDVHGTCNQVNESYAVCECHNYWTGEDCDICPDNRDSYSDCLECNGDWYGEDCDKYPNILKIGNLYWQNDIPIRLRYYDAQHLCSTLNLGGYSNWRLPTIDELIVIVAGCPGFESCPLSEENNDRSINEINECLPSNCRGAGPGTDACCWEAELSGGLPECSDYYWSTTTLPEPENYLVWGIIYRDPNAEALDTRPEKFDEHRCRCVRED